jgi:hypothetical protein
LLHFAPRALILTKELRELIKCTAAKCTIAAFNRFLPFPSLFSRQQATTVDTLMSHADPVTPVRLTVTICDKLTRNLCERLHPPHQAPQFVPARTARGWRGERNRRVGGKSIRRDSGTLARPGACTAYGFKVIKIREASDANYTANAPTSCGSLSTTSSSPS